MPQLCAWHVWSWGLEAHCQKGTLVNLRIMPWFVFLQHLWTLIYISMRTHNIIVIIIIVFATPHLDSDVAMSHLLKASWLKYYKGSRLCILDSPWHGVPSPRSSPLIAAIVWCAGKKGPHVLLHSVVHGNGASILEKPRGAPLIAAIVWCAGKKKIRTRTFCCTWQKSNWFSVANKRTDPKDLSLNIFLLNPVLLYGVAPWTP